jgi:DNA-binding LytR/AlgR family response regulator
MSPAINQSKILLFDSNDSFRNLFNSLLNKIGVGKVILADSLQQANTLFKDTLPHICILDIEDANSRKSSLDFAASIRKQGNKVPIIFLATDAHANEPQGKRIACTYSNVLNKDLSPSRLLQAIKYALLQLENSILIEKNKETNHAAPSVQVVSPLKGDRQQLFFKIGDSFRAIDKKEISFFFAENKMTYARVGKRNFPTNVQLKAFESSLFPCFIRCHKKYIVNVSHIEYISTKDDNVKINDQVLPIGYSYRKSLLSNLSLLK